MFFTSEANANLVCVLALLTELQGVPGSKYVLFNTVDLLAIRQEATTKYYTMEALLPGDDYKKWSNNFGFVTEGEDYSATLQAFSHWTYHMSGGLLMVVDLQGCVKTTKGVPAYLLTDPAIHCTDPLRFQPTNCCKEGFERFFATHKCNGVCKKLGLPRHRLQPRESIMAGTVLA